MDFSLDDLQAGDEPKAKRQREGPEEAEPNDQSEVMAELALATARLTLQNARAVAAARADSEDIWLLPRTAAVSKALDAVFARYISQVEGQKGSRPLCS